jgi:hypothetical protein
MRMTFEGVWADFRHRLKPRTTIKNWSIKGYTGGEFRIDNVDGAAILLFQAMANHGQSQRRTSAECMPYGPPTRQAR